MSKGCWPRRAEGFARPAGFKGLGDFAMKTIVSLLKDKAGVSSTQMALMIGLSSSAVLVLVRMAVAAVAQ
jgi:hypothetical protein